MYWTGLNPDYDSWKRKCMLTKVVLSDVKIAIDRGLPGLETELRNIGFPYAIQIPDTIDEPIEDIYKRKRWLLIRKNVYPEDNHFEDIGRLEHQWLNKNGYSVFVILDNDYWFHYTNFRLRDYRYNAVVINSEYNRTPFKVASFIKDLFSIDSGAFVTCPGGQVFARNLNISVMKKELKLQEKNLKKKSEMKKRARKNG